MTMSTTGGAGKEEECSSSSSNLPLTKHRKGFADHDWPINRETMDRSESWAAIITVVVIVILIFTFLIPRRFRRIRYTGYTAGILGSGLGILLWVMNSSHQQRICSSSSSTTRGGKRGVQQRSISANVDVDNAAAAVASPMWGFVCRDGRESIQCKLHMASVAKKSIVASLNYGGGECMNKFLTIIEQQLTRGVKVCILASDMFMQPENMDTIERLRREFSDSGDHLLWWQWADRATELVSDFPSGVKFSSNHVKAMVIDGGTAFITGGTGIQDAYDLTGMDRRDIPELVTGHGVPAMGEKFLATAYRDMDWCIGSRDGTVTVEGHQVMIELVNLAQRWRKLEEIEYKKKHHGCTASSSSGEGGGEHNLQLKLWIPATTLTSRENILAPLPLPKGLATRATSIETLKSFVTSPIHSSIPFHKQLTHSLERARSRVYIAHMFIHLSTELKHAVLMALRNGAHVTIVTNAITKYTPMTHWLFVPRSRDVCAWLLERAEWEGLGHLLEIYEFSQLKCTFHKKAIVIDNQVWMGNSNLGDKSLIISADDELNFCIHSNSLANETIKVIETDLELCRKYDSDIFHDNFTQPSLSWIHANLLGSFLG